MLSTYALIFVFLFIFEMWYNSNTLLPWA